MRTPSPPASKQEEGGKTLAGLASRSDLPARVRNALQGILDLCATHISLWLAAVLDDLEKDLFTLAERAPNTTTQQRYFDSLNAIKRQRADVVQRFMAVLEDCLVRFDRAHTLPKPDTEPVRSNSRAPMSIISCDDLEEMLALQEFVLGGEKRETDELYALGQRFGALVGAEEIGSEALPVGPAMLANALRDAARCLDVPTDHRVMLYQTFDRKAKGEVGGFYGLLNGYFRDHGILENVRERPAEKRNPSAEEAAKEPKPEKAEPETQEPRQREAERPRAPSMDAPARHSASSGRPSMREAQRSATEAGDGLGSGSGPEPRARYPWGTGGWHAPSQAAADEIDAEDHELFAAVSAALSKRRQGRPSAHASANRGAENVAAPADLQAALRTMQERVSASAPAGVMRRSAEIKRELLARLHHTAPDGRPAQLADEDSDAIDLMSMLLDAIGNDPRSGNRTKALLAKLQMPFLRVPLHDKSFFSTRTHPARQLLNAIAELGMFWLDDPSGDADRELMDKLDAVTDRIVREFDGGVGLIEESLGDVVAHLQTLVRKAEAVERRHVEAAKAREKLITARRIAAEEIAHRVSARTAPAIRTVLEQFWADVLALNVLRHGVRSEAFEKSLGVADRLAGIADGEGSAASDELREDLRSGLAQIGFQEGEIESVIAHMFAPAAGNSKPDTELSQMLMRRARLGGNENVLPEKPADDPLSATNAVEDAGQPIEHAEGGTTADAAGTSASVHRGLRKDDPPRVGDAGTPGNWRSVLTAEERNTLALLGTIPFGTWFEFASDDGRRVRRRLSWYSPVTGRCLFVNQRGAQAEDSTIEQLARDLVRKRAVVVKMEPDSLVDRAYRAIVNSVKSFAGLGAAPKHAPA